jgi:hypothetical protein
MTVKHSERKVSASHLQYGELKNWPKNSVTGKNCATTHTSLFVALLKAIVSNSDH